MLKIKKQTNPIQGKIKCQGDFDISMLSLLVASLAKGNSTINGLLESQEILNLIDILKQFGVSITKQNNSWIVEGKGIESLKEPKNVVDVRVSDITLYLLMGLFSSFNFKVFFKADDSLEELDLSGFLSIFKQLGIIFHCRENLNLPLLMEGSKNKLGLKYNIDIFNYTLKNSLLLSALANSSQNFIFEKEKTRDHLEILMKYFGIVYSEKNVGAQLNISSKIGKEISLNGMQNYAGKDINVPADISFASFITTLALIIPDSDITLEGILMNPFRDAFFRTLMDIGADITFSNQKIVCGEKISDINVKYSKLKDIVISANRIYKMIYEYPALILLSCLSDVSIKIQGIDEIKKYDAEGYGHLIKFLKELNIRFTENKDTFEITSNLGELDKEVEVDKNIMDDRISLFCLLFGCRLKKGATYRGDLEKTFPRLKEFLVGVGLDVE